MQNFGDIVAKTEGKVDFEIFLFSTYDNYIILFDYTLKYI